MHDRRKFIGKSRTSAAENYERMCLWWCLLRFFCIIIHDRHKSKKISMNSVLFVRLCLVLVSKCPFRLVQIIWWPFLFMRRDIISLGRYLRASFSLYDWGCSCLLAAAPVLRKLPCFEFKRGMHATAIIINNNGDPVVCTSCTVRRSVQYDTCTRRWFLVSLQASK